MQANEISTAIVPILTQVYGHVKVSLPVPLLPISVSEKARIITDLLPLRLISNADLSLCKLTNLQICLLHNLGGKLVRIIPEIDCLCDTCIDKHLHAQ